MRYSKARIILEACQMSFNGTANQDIAKKLGVTDATVSRWRKLPLWIEMEIELLAAEKKAMLNAQLRYSGAEQAVHKG